MNLLWAQPQTQDQSGGDRYNSFLLKELANVGCTISLVETPIKSVGENDLQPCMNKWDKALEIMPDLILEDALCYQFLNQLFSLYPIQSIPPRISICHADHGHLSAINGRHSVELGLSRYYQNADAVVFVSDYLKQCMNRKWLINLCMFACPESVFVEFMIVIELNRCADPSAAFKTISQECIYPHSGMFISIVVLSLENRVFDSSKRKEESLIPARNAFLSL